MTHEMFLLLLERRKQNAARRALNERVAAASAGRPHHQACPLGGLFCGMGVDASGSPCWCGATETNDALNEQ